MEQWQNMHELFHRHSIWRHFRWHWASKRSCRPEKLFVVSSLNLAPAVGFEPTTNRLIPTESGLYHFATHLIPAGVFGSGAPISTP